MNLSPDRIDLALVERGADGRPRARSFRSYPRDRSAEQMLARLRKDYRLGSQRCITALDKGEYQILQLDAPDVPREEMREAVRWRIKDMIDFPPEEATIDVVAVPADSAGGLRARAVQVFCARNETIRARMQAFDAAGIALEAIDVPEMALRNVADLWAEPDRAVALISFDDAGGLLVIVAGGDLHAWRRIDVTAAQLAGDDDEQRAAHFDRIALEMRRSFDHYGRQFGAVPLSRIRVAAPMAPELVLFLAKELDLPVAPADLAEVMDLSAVPELLNVASQARCLATIGMALRNGERAA